MTDHIEVPHHLTDYPESRVREARRALYRSVDADAVAMAQILARMADNIATLDGEYPHALVSGVRAELSAILTARELDSAMAESGSNPA